MPWWWMASKSVFVAIPTTFPWNSVADANNSGFDLRNGCTTWIVRCVASVRQILGILLHLEPIREAMRAISLRLRFYFSIAAIVEFQVSEIYDVSQYISIIMAIFQMKITKLRTIAQIIGTAKQIKATVLQGTNWFKSRPIKPPSVPRIFA